MNRRNTDLINQLKENGLLQDPSLEAAFHAADRIHFVPDEYKVEAYEDYALPIPADQTISQPTTVAFMLEKLGVQPGDRVLDVGSGLGWTTALLAHLVGETGRVYGIENVPELVEFGRENLTRSKPEYDTADIQLAHDTIGLPSEAPFDRILVSASADALPPHLIDQLKPGGVMVIPVQESIYHIEKDEDGETHEEEFPGFAFVPLH